MALTLLERGQLTRYREMAKPAQRRIAQKKAKAKKILDELGDEIRELEAKNAIFEEQIAILEAKEKGETVTKEETETKE